MSNFLKNTEAELKKQYPYKIKGVYSIPFQVELPLVLKKAKSRYN